MWLMLTILWGLVSTPAHVRVRIADTNHETWIHELSLPSLLNVSEVPADKQKEMVAVRLRNNIIIISTSWYLGLVITFGIRRCTLRKIAYKVWLVSRYICLPEGYTCKHVYRGEKRELFQSFFKNIRFLNPIIYIRYAVNFDCCKTMSMWLPPFTKPFCCACESVISYF